MFAAYRSVAALLLALCLAVAGNGLIGTMLPLAAENADWSKRLIGFLGSLYFMGMLAGSFVSPFFIARLGHDRAFMAVIGISTVATLGFSVIRDPLAWMLFRCAIGFSFAVLYSTVESWLQATAENAVRGRVLAAYSVVQYFGWAAGNEAVTLGKPGSSVLFEIGAMAIVAAIIPIAMSRSGTPERPTSPKLPVNLLWSKAPLGLVGVFLIGLANGPFWTLTPIYGSGIGLSTAHVGTFITMLTVGAALFQIPVGRLSDRFDRRKVLVGLLGVSVVLELVLGLFGALISPYAVLALGLCIGGVIATQYFVLIAHVNDRTGRENAVGVAALMLFVFCVGAIIGPATAADAMARFGAGALFFHNGLVHAAFIGYVLWRMMKASAPLDRTTEPVVLRSATS